MTRGQGFIVIDIFVPLLQGVHGKSSHAPMEIDQYLFAIFLDYEENIN